MKYHKVKKGIFQKREKRFIGYVELDGEVHKVHVKQTGRCEELLIPGVEVFVETAVNPNRKTKYTLISVIKPNGRLVNIDSQVPNKMFHDALIEGLALSGFDRPYNITPESTWGNSRFDFKLESKYPDTKDNKTGVTNSSKQPINNTELLPQTAYIEVKGVTLEEDGVVIFPDAPTERGLKHVRELIRAKEEGYAAYVVFVIQLEKIKYFTPNKKTDPALSEALKEAQSKGVQILAFDSVVTEDSIRLGKPVSIRL